MLGRRRGGGGGPHQWQHGPSHRVAECGWLRGGSTQSKGGFADGRAERAWCEERWRPCWGHEWGCALLTTRVPHKPTIQISTVDRVTVATAVQYRLSTCTDGYRGPYSVLLYRLLCMSVSHKARTTTSNIVNTAVQYNYKRHRQDEIEEIQISNVP